MERFPRSGILRITVGQRFNPKGVQNNLCSSNLDEVRERIRQRSYVLYELLRKKYARDFDDWLKAESEVTGKADPQ
jgi:hypothetical protein